MLIHVTRFFTVFLLFVVPALATDRAAASSFTIEDSYLSQRADLQTKLSNNPDSAKDHKHTLDSLKINTIRQLKVVMPNNTAHYRWLFKMVTQDTIDSKMPFDLLEYLPLHRFQSHNTFTVPVKDRIVINMEFKDGWQYTNGVKAVPNYDYQYKLETKTSFRRTRPLSGGGFGSDVIDYNPLTNRFEKAGNLFMWKAK